MRTWHASSRYRSHRDGNAGGFRCANELAVGRAGVRRWLFCVADSSFVHYRRIKMSLVGFNLSNIIVYAIQSEALSQ